MSATTDSAVTTPALSADIAALYADLMRITAERDAARADADRLAKICETTLTRLVVLSRKDDNHFDEMFSVRQGLRAFLVMHKKAVTP